MALLLPCWLIGHGIGPSVMPTIRTTLLILDALADAKQRVR